MSFLDNLDYTLGHSYLTRFNTTMLTAGLLGTLAKTPIAFRF
jgi:hypothetical protein